MASIDKKNKNDAKGDTKSDKAEPKGEGSVSPKRILQEIALLRAEIDAVKAAQNAAQTPPSPDAEPINAPEPGEENAAFIKRYGGLPRILQTGDNEAAQLGQAFASPQKIALLRVLFSDGPQSARELEEKAHLTTGSLYHHLRELSHARVIASPTRSRYELTPRGRDAFVWLLAQAGGME